MPKAQNSAHLSCKLSNLHSRGPEMEEEEDERREAAIALAPALQPNFKSSGVSKDQLSKFQVKFLFFHGDIGLVLWWDHELACSTLSGFYFLMILLQISYCSPEFGFPLIRQASRSVESGLFRVCDDISGKYYAITNKLSIRLNFTNSSLIISFPSRSLFCFFIGIPFSTQTWLRCELCS